MPDTTPNTNPDGVGRQWKLTRRRLDRILSGVKAGAPMSTAAKSAGIATSTFWKYHTAGLALLERALEEGIIDPDLLDLAESDAQAKADQAAIAQGHQSAPAVDSSRVLGDALRAAGWPDIDCLFVELVDGVAKAEAEGELRLVTLVSGHAAKSWQAGIALLSRRWPDRYKEHTAAELSGAGGGPVQITTDAELARKIRDDPEARRLSDELLARVTPTGPPLHRNAGQDDLPGADLPDDDDGADEAG